MEVIIVIIIIIAIVIIIIIIVNGVTILSNYGVTTVTLLNVSPGPSPLFYRSTCQLIYFKLYFVSGIFTRNFLPSAGIRRPVQLKACDRLAAGRPFCLVSAMPCR